MLALLYCAPVIFKVSSMFQAENFAYKTGYRNLTIFHPRWHTVTVHVNT